MPAATKPPPNPAWVRPFLLLESIIFPLAFLLLAGTIVRKFLQPLDAPMLGAGTVWAAAGVLLDLALHPEKIPPGFPRVQIYGILGMAVLRPVILFFFNTLCAGFLALRGRLRYEPGSLREILVPIAGTTIILLLPISARLPSWLRHPLSYPPGWVPMVLGLAGALSVVGALVMLHGLLHLRRNFSVFVEVREIVFSGLYRYVRHPLYIGEILLCAGLVLTIPSLFSLVALFLLIVFQYARARMEEGRLAAASPEYAKRMAVTGMFFPRFRASRLPGAA